MFRLHARLLSVSHQLVMKVDCDLCLWRSSVCAHWVAKDPSFLHADSEDSDQTGQMPRLI